MATTKRRLNISLPPDMEKALGHAAKRDKVPEATKAAELLRIALEIEEDFMLGTLAKNRLAERARVYSHKDAWK